MCQWIEVEEQLPEEGQVVDVWTEPKEGINSKNIINSLVYCRKNKRWRFDCNIVGMVMWINNDCNITHWMPQPKSPNEQSVSSDVFKAKWQAEVIKEFYECLDTVFAEEEGNIPSDMIPLIARADHKLKERLRNTYGHTT